ncbi:hypothetical protein P4H42_17055 [Paenibacillus macerans]|uniref:hypothetical protein n=1 Tax=Paenibacillus macerans TaxID=44252 RepID=UPI002DBE9A7E|nr:hypothetical protein [Paenibacillus macerans]MEC0331322.1 hypothetical protein [Paenibacillus macerans]MED4954053.1 hypothetical protein [Paenibacillus macerans]
MNINNLDIAKQHIRDLQMEMERCRIAEQMRRLAKERAKSMRNEAPREKKRGSLLTPILMKMRRLL